MPTTEENLREAFAGESQAFQKYMSYAEKAEKEGFANVARLFRTTAQAERVHAAGHLKALQKVQTTLENLEDAIAGETYETETMYPPMLEQARADGHPAQRMFGYAVEAEAVHARLYRLAREAVARGEDLAETDFYLCPVCGHIELGSPPQRCPICGAKAAAFVTV